MAEVSRGLPQRRQMTGLNKLGRRTQPMLPQASSVWKRAAGLMLIACCFSVRHLCWSITSHGSAALRRLRGGSKASLVRGGELLSAAHEAEGLLRVPLKASVSWILPSVDKDTEDFYSGVTDKFAWVQTSSVLYLFAPVGVQSDGKGEKKNPSVMLEIEEEGSYINFEVEGKIIVEGPMQYAVKPGEEIWMVEEAPDGQTFVVVELTKVPQGKEWSSVLKPEVMLAGLEKLKITARLVSDEDQAAAVEATLQHIRRQRCRRAKAGEGHKAAVGDYVTIDMEGFEITPDGTRGAPLAGVPPAKGQKFELGSPDGFPQEVQEQMVGITVGETRDVQAKLGGKRPVILAVTCTNVAEQFLPDLDDDFAKDVKRAEQFVLAGTEAGVPEEEEDAAETFTLHELRNEIAAEVQREADSSTAEDFRRQLQAQMLENCKIQAEWANNLGGKTSARDEVPPPQAQEAEELAAIADYVVNKEGLFAQLDEEAMKREAWDVLATPKDKSQAVAEVGADPDRDFQAAHERVLRKHRMNVVLSWLEQRAEIVEA
eukprot:TRINITY_DN582_c0_g1_i1.p1 TRINITY_DN582_c0_g1~~TRINITY_DN582_c0_g1_i1.p1  ORF type:complete len:542 (-),score=188.08 TRINITY_DN582_c0_g1_i1:287-1912(-)